MAADFNTIYGGNAPGRLNRWRVVRSMTSLCRDMGMLVVGEGVETATERDMLVELGCELLQGFLFAKPSPPFPAVRW